VRKTASGGEIIGSPEKTSKWIFFRVFGLLFRRIPSHFWALGIKYPMPRLQADRQNSSAIPSLTNCKYNREPIKSGVSMLWSL
jgi:hypothetical protein